MAEEFDLVEGSQYRVPGFSEPLTARRASMTPDWIADRGAGWVLTGQEGDVTMHSGKAIPPRRSRNRLIWVDVDGSLYDGDTRRQLTVKAHDLEQLE
jgi:hypothetical protein